MDAVTNKYNTVIFEEYYKVQVEVKNQTVGHLCREQPLSLSLLCICCVSAAQLQSVVLMH